MALRPLKVTCLAGCVTDWLQTETLERDFQHIFGRFIEFRPPFAFQKRNAQEYQGKSLTAPELERLYAACPIWTQLEMALYGNTLLDLLESQEAFA